MGGRGGEEGDGSGESSKSVNGDTETQHHKQPREQDRVRQRKRGGGLRGEGGEAHWRWEASLIPLCISFTSLAVSTNRIGSKAQGLGGE